LIGDSPQLRFPAVWMLNWRCTSCWPPSTNQHHWQLSWS